MLLFISFISVQLHVDMDSLPCFCPWQLKHAAM